MQVRRPGVSVATERTVRHWPVSDALVRRRRASTVSRAVTSSSGGFHAASRGLALGDGRADLCDAVLAIKVPEPFDDRIRRRGTRAAGELGEVARRGPIGIERAQAGDFGIHPAGVALGCEIAQRRFIDLRLRRGLEPGSRSSAVSVRAALRQRG